MANARLYRIPDEPLPSGLSRFVVDPMWPLLATMLGGSGIGMAWFAFNAAAMGSPNRRREALAIAAGFALVLVSLFALEFARQRGWLQGEDMAYGVLLPTALKLVVAYWLYTSQSACFELWEHYGGTPRNGLLPAAAAAMFGNSLVQSLSLPVALTVLLQ